MLQRGLTGPKARTRFRKKESFLNRAQAEVLFNNQAGGLNGRQRRNKEFQAVISQIKLMAVWSLAVLSLTCVFDAASAATGGALPGSICEAQDAGYSKQQVGSFGAVGNKSTTATLKVSCPFFPAFFGSYDLWVDYSKPNTKSLSCTLHQRDLFNQSGLSQTKSTTASGNSFIPFYVSNSLYYSNLSCTLPIATSSTSGRTQINGIYYY